MERVENIHFGSASLRDEHVHRYELAARVARGHVVDCACGIGYGSEIIAKQSSVESYLGIDPSKETIDTAIKNYSSENIRFECGKIERNKCDKSSVDTFLMFETLEHTEDPNVALANVRACLKLDGLLVGSVPSAEYEALCESTYGANPFHLQRFTKEKIIELISQYFSVVRVFSVEFILGSLIQCIDECVDSTEIGYKARYGDIDGSILFIAGSEDSVKQAIIKIGALRKFWPSIPKVILDRDEVAPLRATMQSMEALVRGRDEAIAEQGRMLEERWLTMQSMEALIRGRDEAIAEQERMLEERWLTMQSMEVMIRERDETINDLQQLPAVHSICQKKAEPARALFSALKALLRHRVSESNGKRR